MTSTVKKRPRWLGSHLWPVPSRATLRLNILILLLAGMLALPVLAASEVSEAEAIFGKRCSGCHTYGKGIRVGPDLKGVTDRHPRSWLLLFIQSSQSVIRGGDPTAVALFRQFKQQRMPDHDLSLKQIESLLDYLASGGLESARQDERDADTATPAEINGGRRLFYGEAHLARAGPACSSCHCIFEVSGQSAHIIPRTSMLPACSRRFPDPRGVLRLESLSAASLFVTDTAHHACRNPPSRTNCDPDWE